MWLDQTCWHGVRAQTYSVFTVLVRLMRVAIIKKTPCTYAAPQLVVTTTCSKYT